MNENLKLLILLDKYKGIPEIKEIYKKNKIIDEIKIKHKSLSDDIAEKLKKFDIDKIK